jgi:hypothetical protein
MALSCVSAFCILPSAFAAVAVFRVSAFCILPSAFAAVWLGMALSCVSAFCPPSAVLLRRTGILPSAFAAVWLGVAVTGDRKWPMANGQLGEDSPANCPVARDLRSRFGVQGSRFKVRSRLDVGCWMLDVPVSFEVRSWPSVSAIDWM